MVAAQDRHELEPGDRVYSVRRATRPRACSATCGSIRTAAAAASSSIATAASRAGASRGTRKAREIPLQGCDLSADRRIAIRSRSTRVSLASCDSSWLLPRMRAEACSVAAESSIGIEVESNRKCPPRPRVGNSARPRGSSEGVDAQSVVGFSGVDVASAAVCAGAFPRPPAPPSPDGQGIGLSVGSWHRHVGMAPAAPTRTLQATQGDQINFCYIVTNNSTTTLTYQSLADDVTGPILTDVPATIAPGASYQYNRIVTAMASQAPVSTWTAYDVHPDYVYRRQHNESGYDLRRRVRRELGAIRVRRHHAAPARTSCSTMTTTR